MGQKIHPKGFRLGYIEDWTAKWFGGKRFPLLLVEDLKIRKIIEQKTRSGEVSKVKIERAGDYVRMNIFTARPGIIIGKKGQDVENLRKNIEKLIHKKTFINIIEIKVPELEAKLVAGSVAFQLERKISYRRAIKRAIERTMKRGALGIKICVSGRLSGAEIARTEWLKEGRIPLQTLRAEIDYGFKEAFTTYGRIGVKVWIFKKEIFLKEKKKVLPVINQDNSIENNNKEKTTVVLSEGEKNVDSEKG